MNRKIGIITLTVVNEQTLIKNNKNVLILVIERIFNINQSEIKMDNAKYGRKKVKTQDMRLRTFLESFFIPK
ncbi:unnamed protein product [marine sediment metagenome]|uniref:Uncharacterized protein n=1 Tax=marine sediment metagenome TaxID=412755 RepID=X1I521_9ZZZZ